MPSSTSISTTSASSFEAIQWAAVAPTFPPPTIVTFLRMKSFLLNGNFLAAVHHVVNKAVGKLAGFHFGSAGHEALEILSYFLLLNRGFQRSLDHARRFTPSQKIEHHHAGEDH